MSCRRFQQLLALALALSTTTASPTNAQRHLSTASSSSSSSSKSDATVASTQSLQIPWVVVVATSQYSSPFSGQIDEDACVGVMVTPTAALMPAACLIQNSKHPQVAIALADGMDSERSDVLSPVASRRHWRLRDVASITRHPQYDSGSLANNFAVLRWQTPILMDTTAVHPVVVLEEEDPSPADQQQMILTIQGDQERHVPAVMMQTPTGCEQDKHNEPKAFFSGSLVCVEATWTTTQKEEQPECKQQQQQQHGFLTRMDGGGDRIILSGILMGKMTCNTTTTTTTKNDTSESHGTIAVAPLADVRAWIDAALRGHEDEKEIDNGSSMAAGTETPSPSPSSSSDIDILPPVGWRLDLLDKFGFLTSSETFPTTPQDVQASGGGGLAVIIAPHFLLTRRSWVSGDKGLAAMEWVHLQSQSVRIARLHFQQQQLTSRDNDPLVVIEVDPEIDPKMAAAVQLPTRLPVYNKDLDLLTTWAVNKNEFTRSINTEEYDRMLTFANPYNALVDRALCLQPPTELTSTDTELICVESSGPVAHLFPQFMPFNQSFLFFGDHLLVALSQGASNSSEQKKVAQVYEPLGASQQVRAFLDHATNNTVIWADKETVYDGDDGSTSETSQLLFDHVVLYEKKEKETKENKEESDPMATIIPCGVVPITQRFYLALASCLQGRNVDYVTYEPATPPSNDDGGIATEARELGEPSGMILGSDSNHPKEEEEPRDPDTDASWLPKGAYAVKTVHVHPLFQSKRSLAHDFAIIELVELIPWTHPVLLLASGSQLPLQTRVVEHPIGTPTDNDVAAAEKYSVVVDPSECHQDKNSELLCVAASSSHCSEASAIHSTTLALFHRVAQVSFFVGFASHGDDCRKTKTYSPVATIANFINAVVDAPRWGNQQQLANPATSFKQPIAGTRPISKPFVVGLRMTKNGQNFCGGSLIAPQFVLTAAHCVTDGVANWVSIGSLESSGSNTEPIPIITSRIRIHPQYKSPYKFSHDAAILELAVPAYGATVALDGTLDFLDGQPAAMYGYGVESASSDVLSSVMHARELTILSKTTCSQTLPEIDDAVLCALAVTGLDACTGDSGSPLVVSDPKTGHEILVGVVSAGYGCGVAGVPGLYTRIAELMSFIDAYSVGSAWVNAPPPVAVGGGATAGTGGHGSSTSPPKTPTPSGSTNNNSNGNGTDVSTLPLEERGGQTANSSSSSTSSSSTTANGNYSTTTGDAAGGSYVSAIQKTPLPRHSLSVWTKTKLLDFLIGDDSFLTPSLRDALRSPENAVTLFSSGNVSGLVRVLSNYNSQPLNKRQDRFQTASSRDYRRGGAAGGGGGGEVSMATVCTTTHSS